MFKKQPLPSRGWLQRSWFSFFLLAAIASGADTARPFLGAIPVQFVAPGQELILDMHRFFHPGASAKLDFGTNDNVDLAFDSTTFQLRVRPQKAGLFDVELSTPSGKSRLVTVLTVAATSGLSSHHFSFKPADPATKVYLSVDHEVYAFVRAHLDDCVVAIFNRGKTDAKVDMNVSPELSDGDYADALTGKSVQVKDGKMEFTLPAQTAAFVTRMK